MSTIGQQTKVVAIDDHTLFLDAIDRILDASGLKLVGTAHTGIEGVGLCRKVKPDLVLIDLTLPGMDGIETGRQVLEIIPSVTMIMLTESNDPEVVRLALKVGFQGFVAKSTPLVRFLSAIRMALDGHVVIPQNGARRVGTLDPAEEAIALLTDQLTQRERAVLALLVEGAGSADIAERLGISPNTVRSHVQNVLTKLQVHSRLEAAAFAVRHDVVKRAHGASQSPALFR